MYEALEPRPTSSFPMKSILEEIRIVCNQNYVHDKLFMIYNQIPSSNMGRLGVKMESSIVYRQDL